MNKAPNERVREVTEIFNQLSMHVEILRSPQILKILLLLSITRTKFKIRTKDMVRDFILFHLNGY